MSEQHADRNRAKLSGQFWLSAGAAVAAVLAASCCVLPIALTIVGLGGSWLAMLGPFVAYREPILLGAGLAVAWSWYRLLWRRPGLMRRRARLAMAIIATVALALAVSAPLWENQLAREMWGYLVGAR